MDFRFSNGPGGLVYTIPVEMVDNLNQLLVVVWGSIGVVLKTKRFQNLLAK